MKKYEGQLWIYNSSSLKTFMLDFLLLKNVPFQKNIYCIFYVKTCTDTLVFVELTVMIKIFFHIIWFLNNFRLFRKI